MIEKYPELEKYLLAKKGAMKDFPFGPDVAVFKVMGKMFACASPADDPLRLNLKCDPEKAQILRKVYSAVLPGYHLNKEHWNTVILDGSVPETELKDMIRHSWLLVAGKLKKSERECLGIK